MGPVASGNSAKTGNRRTRNSLSKEEILEAALALLTEEGIDRLSMRRIADRLHCSVASPYAYFKSQEEIVKSLIELGEQSLTAELKSVESRHLKTVEKLEAIARTYWDFARENKELHKIMFNMYHGQLHRKALPILPTSYRVYLEAIREGFRTGEFAHKREEYPAIARTMWAWIYGLIMLDLTGMLKKRRGGKDPFDEGIRYFRDLLAGDPQD